MTHLAGCAVLFNKETLSTLTSASNPCTIRTRGEVCTIIFVEGEHRWVLQGGLSRASFRAAASGQKVLTVFLYTSTMFLPRKDVLPRKASRALVLLSFLKRLIWLQVTSMVPLGDVAAQYLYYDEVFSDCPAYAAGRHTLVETGIELEHLGRRVVFSSP